MKRKHRIKVKIYKEKGCISAGWHWLVTGTNKYGFSICHGAGPFKTKKKAKKDCQANEWQWP